MASSPELPLTFFDDQECAFFLLLVEVNSTEAVFSQYIEQQELGFKTREALLCP